MRFIAIAVAAWFELAACTSDRHASYERLAREANPGLGRLRASTSMILGAEHRSTREMVSACRDANAELSELRYALYRDDAIREQQHRVAYEVQRTQMMWRHLCRRPSTAVEELEICVDECVDCWKRLAAEVEQLRSEAAGEGVKLESLAPWRKRLK